MQPDPSSGADASRLLLVMSELSGAQADWVRGLVGLGVRHKWGHGSLGPI
jgi:hypothetical protein